MEGLAAPWEPETEQANGETDAPDQGRTVQSGRRLGATPEEPPWWTVLIAGKSAHDGATSMAERGGVPWPLAHWPKIPQTRLVAGFWTCTYCRGRQPPTDRWWKRTSGQGEGGEGAIPLCQECAAEDNEQGPTLAEIVMILESGPFTRALSTDITSGGTPAEPTSIQMSIYNASVCSLAYMPAGKDGMNPDPWWTGTRGYQGTEALLKEYPPTAPGEPFSLGRRWQCYGCGREPGDLPGEPKWTDFGEVNTGREYCEPCAAGLPGPPLATVRQAHRERMAEIEQAIARIEAAYPDGVPPMHGVASGMAESESQCHTWADTVHRWRDPRKTSGMPLWGHTTNPPPPPTPQPPKPRPPPLPPRVPPGKHHPEHGDRHMDVPRGATGAGRSPATSKPAAAPTTSAPPPRPAPKASTAHARMGNGGEPTLSGHASTEPAVKPPPPPLPHGTRETIAKILQSMEHVTRSPPPPPRSPPPKHSRAPAPPPPKQQQADHILDL